MHKEEPKICPKCGEHYFGKHCVGCHSNQYAHYSFDSSIINKILIILFFVITTVIILIKK